MNGAINNFDSTKQHFPKVAIIILNWNGWKDTLECLESVFRIDYLNYQVIVVDNGSSDDSVEKIKAWVDGNINVDLKVNSFFEEIFSKPIVRPIGFLELKSSEILCKDDLYKHDEHKLILIESEKNLGFAGGNNLGIKYAMNSNIDYVFLINNDLVVDRYAVKKLINLSMTEKDVGILGSKVYSYDNPNIIQSFGAKINLWTGRSALIYQGELDSEKYNFVSEVDWVGGGAMLIRKNVLEKAGLLDSGYFLCYEDTDFCLRAKKVGFRIIAVPSSKVWHKGGRSLNRSLADYYLTLNRVRFMKLNSDLVHFLVFIIFYLVGTLKRFCTSLLNGDIKTAGAIGRGFLFGLTFIFKKVNRCNEKKL